MHVGENQKVFIRQWLPSLLAGLLAWLAFVLIGETPIIRASGLALVIIGVVRSIRRMGAMLSLIGGLTLAFCAAFWAQTGGGDAGPATIVIALLAATLATPLMSFISKRSYIGVGIGIVVFVVLFWSQVGTPKSIRLTSLVTAWLMALVTSMLLLTNPRPDDASPEPAKPYHTLGILLLFIIGSLNDPLLTLLAPAVVLSLVLADTKQPLWYWGILFISIGIGIRGIVVDYLYGAEELVILNGWREATRWIDMVNLVIAQFSVVGFALGILGVARLARWYPPLGIVTMVGYAAYVFFGLVYMGRNRDFLLLPLLLIQVIWMTYAVFTVTQWLQKSSKNPIVRWSAVALYFLMPLVLLSNIVIIH